MKVVVYTAILNGYDKLRNHVDLPYDFIAYIDDKSIVPANTNWQIRDIPEEIAGLSMFDQINYLKHMPHKLFPEYDISVWEDGKVSINKNIQSLLDLDYEDNKFISNKHPERQNIFDEIDILRKWKLEKKETCDKLEQKYKQEGFPKDYGLVDTCMMIRRHNDPYVSEIMEEALALLNKYRIVRHELVLTYVLWKQNKTVSVIPFDVYGKYTSKFFTQYPHYKQHYHFAK